MLTVSILIGNSDNKLSQSDWSAFCYAVQMQLESCSENIFFSGGSAWNNARQNACWVAAVYHYNLAELKTKLTKVREQYKQESVAIVVGNTEFI